MVSRATVARAVTVVVLRATVVIRAPALLPAQVAIAAEAMNRRNIRMTRMATDPAKALQAVVRLHLILLAQLWVANVRLGPRRRLSVNRVRWANRARWVRVGRAASPACPANPACPGHLDQTAHFRRVRLVYPVARLVYLMEHCRQEADQENSLPAV